MVDNAVLKNDDTFDDDYLSQFVPNCHFEQIRICDLVSNQDYQRNLSLSLVNSTVQDFDIHQINPAKVSRRNGVNYVYDGQHTIEIIAAASGSRRTPVWCMVFDDMDYQVEAEVFANQQKHKKNLTPYEVFNANIEAGKDRQLLIRDLLASYGLAATPSSTAGGICAIGTVEKIFDKYGFDTLSRTINLIVSTWEGEEFSFTSCMLTGVARLLDAYGDRLKEQMFISKLGRVSTREIIRNARERHSGSLGYAEVMVQYYNKKNKFCLPWEPLHKKKSYSSDAVESEDSEWDERNDQQTIEGYTDDDSDTEGTD